MFETLFTTYTPPTYVHVHIRGPLCLAPIFFTNTLASTFIYQGILKLLHRDSESQCEL